MPSEPGATGFRDRMRLKSYPTVEAGGIIWTYLGPEGSAPAFPQYDWMRLRRSQLAVYKVGEMVNYAQALEGAVDSSHSWFLHRGAIWDWEKRLAISSDTAPRIEVEDTAYGFRYAAIRTPTQHPDTEQYVRVTAFVLPFLCCIVRPFEKETYAHIQIFVPVDNERTMFYGIFFSQNDDDLDEAAVRREHHVVPHVDLDADWYKVATMKTRFNQDREAMIAGDWSGIQGFSNQDMACQESMGPIVDRTSEHLGMSDKAVIRWRKRMLDAAKEYASSGVLVGEGADYEHVRSEQLIIPKSKPWQIVANYAGEYQDPVAASV